METKLAAIVLGVLAFTAACLSQSAVVELRVRWPDRDSIHPVHRIGIIANQAF